MGKWHQTLMATYGDLIERRTNALLFRSSPNRPLRVWQLAAGSWRTSRPSPLSACAIEMCSTDTVLVRVLLRTRPPSRLGRATLQQASQLPSATRGHQAPSFALYACTSLIRCWALLYRGCNYNYWKRTVPILYVPLSSRIKNKTAARTLRQRRPPGEKHRRQGSCKTWCTRCDRFVCPSACRLYYTTA